MNAHSIRKISPGQPDPRWLRAAEIRKARHDALDVSVGLDQAFGPDYTRTTVGEATCDCAATPLSGTDGLECSLCGAPFVVETE
jgi:lipid A disaccharide synthetase